MTTALRYVVGSVCLYESFACFTRRVPTISEYVGRAERKGDLVGGLVLGGLALHFLMAP